MPQIDTVTYFPIVLWSLILLVLGYILFNLLALLWLSNLSKIGSQWTTYEIRSYWLWWNHEETADDLAWLSETAPLFKTETQKE